jgi:ribonuclease P protein component
VKRNRAKRRMRAIFREYSNILKDGTYVFVAKIGLFDSSYEQFNNNFKKVLKQARAMKEL